MVRKPEDDGDRDCQREYRKQEHGCRFRFRGFISSGKEYDNGGQGKAATDQCLTREWTINVQHMHKSEQHDILHGEPAKRTEEYRMRKLKGMSRQYQAYSKNSNTGSRRTNQLKACGYESR